MKVNIRRVRTENGNYNLWVNGKIRIEEESYIVCDNVAAAILNKTRDITEADEIAERILKECEQEHNNE